MLSVILHYCNKTNWLSSICDCRIFFHACLIMRHFAGARRKLLHHQSTIAGQTMANGHHQGSIHASVAAPRLASSEEEEASDDEVEGGAEWNWREDER